MSPAETTVIEETEAGARNLRGVPFALIEAVDARVTELRALVDGSRDVDRMRGWNREIEALAAVSAAWMHQGMMVAA